jgi:methylenetetrahydrofolate dehydrogenase (NADP+) / methenyltetrahydrofolate cyclohydrolase
MSARCLDGRTLAKQLQAELATHIAGVDSQPVLATLQLGDHPATTLFTRAQGTLATRLGLGYTSTQLPSDVTQAVVEAQLKAWNDDPGIHGIFVQNPMPPQIDPQCISAVINPLKDVEGITPHHTARRFFARARIGSCTALAVMALIESTGESLRGREAVVVGNSEIVGRPVGMLLLDQLATTTVCHIATNERGHLQEHIERAEILVAAVGKPSMIPGAWIREGAIVIDVGINVIDGHTVGDVEYDTAAARAAYITPVPGGVGPVTVTMVMKNVLEAYRAQHV